MKRLKILSLFVLGVVCLSLNLGISAQTSSYVPFEYAFDLPSDYHYFDGYRLVMKDKPSYDFNIYVFENNQWKWEGFIPNQGGAHGYSIRVAGIQDDILVLSDYARCRGDDTNMVEPFIQIYGRSNGVWSLRSTTLMDVGNACYEDIILQGTTLVLRVDGNSETHIGEVYYYEIEDYELVLKQSFKVDDVWVGPWSYAEARNPLYLYGDQLFVEAEKIEFPYYNYSRNNVYRAYKKIDGLWVEDEAGLLRMDIKYYYRNRWYAKYPILYDQYMVMQNVIYKKVNDKWEISAFFDDTNGLSDQYFTEYAFNHGIFLTYEQGIKAAVFTRDDTNPFGYNWKLNQELPIDTSATYLNLKIFSENMIQVGNTIYTRNLPVPPTNPTLPPTPEPTSEPTPISTEDLTPISTEETTPISTEEPTPISTEEPTPISTEEPTPISTEDLTPISTEEPTPISTEEPTPISTEEPTPISTEDLTKEPLAVLVIQNGDFESADAWTVKHGASNKIKCDTQHKTVAYANTCAFQFKTVAGGKGKLTQSLNLDHQAVAVGDTLKLSLFARTKKDATLKAKVIVKYHDGQKDKIVLTLQDAPEYTRFADEVQLTDTDITKAIIKFKAKSASGKVFIDDVEVWHVANAQLQGLPTP